LRQSAQGNGDSIEVLFRNRIELTADWGYHQLRQNTETKPHIVLLILMHAYWHTSQEQTLDYLCVQSDEVAKLFKPVEL